MKMILGVAALGLVFGVSGTALASDGAYCREYQKKVVIGGKVQESYGTACMQPDGSWQIDGENVQGPGDGPDEGVNMGVADVEPMGEAYYGQGPVVYQEPVYVQEQVIWPSWGVNLAWADGDWGRGRRDWHGRGHGGHGRHH